MELIAASLGVGSMVCIAVVAKVARNVFDGLSQMVFFRSMGRRYSVVGTTSLLVVIASALVLSWSSLSSSGTTARHSTLAAPDATSRSTRLLASKF
jgi:predicted transcriptional regulator